MSVRAIPLVSGTFGRVTVRKARCELARGGSTAFARPMDVSSTTMAGILSFAIIGITLIGLIFASKRLVRVMWSFWTAFAHGFDENQLLSLIHISEPTRLL